MNKSLPVLNLTSHSDKLFFGESGHGIARYDEVRYQIFQKINAKMQGFFWKPRKVTTLSIFSLFVNS